MRWYPGEKGKGADARDFVPSAHVVCFKQYKAGGSRVPLIMALHVVSAELAMAIERRPRGQGQIRQPWQSSGKATPELFTTVPVAGASRDAECFAVALAELFPVTSVSPASAGSRCPAAGSGMGWYAVCVRAHGT